jgi:hypothetical protein
VSYASTVASLLTWGFQQLQQQQQQQQQQLATNDHQTSSSCRVVVWLTLTRYLWCNVLLPAPVCALQQQYN